MSSSVKRALHSVTQMLTAVTDHVSGADLLRNEERARQEAQQRVAARIEALRAGFSAIRERHDELSGRISEITRRRA